jgi:2-methylcitrate dehydratase PrpD
VGSALSGKVGRPVQAIESVAREVGPTEGRAEVLLSRRKTTSVLAAMVNAASSHFMEQDDVHNGSVFHPGAVVFPTVLALAQDRGISGKEMMTAAVAGYEVGIRVGEFLGQSHYKVFHTTGTAGTIAAAVAAGRAINLPPEKMQHAIGPAGTQAAGLWEFLKDAANSKQLHTAKAALDGTLSALLSEKGFSGAKQILEGAKGMGVGVGLSRDADPARLTDRLGERWATIETSFKFHASCRHTHPAADAFLSLIQQHQLNADQIAAVTTRASHQIRH